MEEHTAPHMVQSDQVEDPTIPPPLDNVHVPTSAFADQIPPSIPTGISTAPSEPDVTAELAASTTNTQASPARASPVARTATPTRGVNGTAAVPATEPSAPPLPAKAASHGAPARRYLNEKVTGVLLEGMKRLAAEQPDMPLRVLGEFLLQKSGELEGRNALGS